MTTVTHFAAVDLGAESGRVMLAHLEPGRLSIDEVHRFPNGPVERDGALHWDFERLMREIKTGLKAALSRQGDLTSIGVDTWGVDYGLIDADRRLLEDPYHYRDRRTEGMIEAACRLMDRQSLYRHTGIQFMPFNTVFQLLACRRQRPDLLEQAQTLLLMPNLIMHRLCGAVFAEYTMASTTQLMDMTTGRWSEPVLAALDLPQRLLPPVRQPGEAAGPLTPEVAAELGTGAVDVVAVGCHDTASAVAAVPVTEDRSWAYLSSGTWSLMGVELPGPVINEQSYRLDYTNEGGVGGTIRLLKNIMGLWLVQECRRQWAREGHEYDYATLTRMAAEAPAFSAVLNTDETDFLAPGDMPAKINRQLERTGQRPIDDKGQMIRVILESLALKYHQTLSHLEELQGRPIEVLHIVGGGIQNGLLNQLTADAIDRPVVTGPVEATVIGNVLVQALAAGRLPDLAAGRGLVARSFPGQRYEPSGDPAWQTYRQRARDLGVL